MSEQNTPEEEITSGGELNHAEVAIPLPPDFVLDDADQEVEGDRPDDVE